jgi:C4-dicarboxylate-specific signal transduction histidine kinase
VDVHNVIRTILSTFDPFLVDRGVAVQQAYCDGAPYLHGSDAALESIITNLLNNSINAFERAATKKRVIAVGTTAMGDNVRITVADSGPGIRDIALRDIWLPGRTTRKNGTGLGLVIVKDTVKDMGGDVSAVANGVLGGAEISVVLPIVGA